jgi:hypothetical protein
MGSQEPHYGKTKTQKKMSRHSEDKRSTYKDGVRNLKEQMKRIKKKQFRHNFKDYQREMTRTIDSERQPKQL